MAPPPAVVALVAELADLVVALAALLLDLEDLVVLEARLLDLLDREREALVLVELLSRPSFSAAMARTTPCPAPAPTYEPVPKSR